jgi:hypothetical protein
MPNNSCAGPPAQAIWIWNRPCPFLAIVSKCFLYVSCYIHGHEDFDFVTHLSHRSQKEST